MIVLDVETTGTDPLKHSLVSIGAVDFDKPERQFYEECRIFEGAHVMEEALVVNGMTHEQITDSQKKSDKEIIEDFLKWVEESDNHTFGGLNHHLDLYFIHMAALRNHIDFAWPKRIVDLHSVSYAHMAQRGLQIPLKNKHTDISGDTTMKYVGIPTEPRPHIGLNGAKWEAEALSRLIYNKNLLPEFSKYPIPWLV
ncbi:MAG: hypothetical protein RJA61_450 [Candidatus Parcubacteria bacterium]|jgi:DNA polymerase III epsilon subunit-like protein